MSRLPQPGFNIIREYTEARNRFVRLSLEWQHEQGPLGQTQLRETVRLTRQRLELETQLRALRVEETQRQFSAGRYNQFLQQEVRLKRESSNLDERVRTRRSETERDFLRTTPGQAISRGQAQQRVAGDAAGREVKQTDTLAFLEARLARLQAPGGRREYLDDVNRQRQTQRLQEAIQYQELSHRYTSVGAAAITAGKSLAVVAATASAASLGLSLIARGGGASVSGTISKSFGLVTGELSLALMPVIVELARMLQGTARWMRENRETTGAIGGWLGRFISMGPRAGAAIGGAARRSPAWADVAEAWWGRRETAERPGTLLESLGRMLSLQGPAGVLDVYASGRRQPVIPHVDFQSRQLELGSQLNDMIQMEATRSPLDQQTFQLEMENLRELVRLAGGTNAILQQIANRPPGTS